MENKTLELLLHSMDNKLTSAEQTRLEEALATSDELRQEQEALLHMRELVADLHVGRDPLFVEEVMNKLQKEKESSFWADIVSLSPKVAAACVAFVIVSLMGIYYWEGSLSPEAIIGTKHLTPEDAFTIQEQRHPQKKDKNTAPPPLELPKNK